MVEGVEAPGDSLLLGKLCILDQAVFPDVSNLNGNLVRTRPGGIGDVYPERRLPQDSEWLIINKDFGDVFHIS